MITSPLPRIARGTAADACTHALRERILGGALPPGSKLPPERTLAEELGVSRITVRAALAALTGERLVEVKHGSGAVVSDFLERGGPSLIAGVVAAAASSEDAVFACVDLLAVRRALAIMVLERVLERIDDSGIGRIHAAVQVFDAVVDEEGKDARAVAAADLDVMRAIVAEARSPVLSLCLNPIASVLNALPKLRAAMFVKPQRSVAAYAMFVELLKAALKDGRAHERLITEMMHVLEDHDEDTIERLADIEAKEEAQRYG